MNPNLDRLSYQLSKTRLKFKVYKALIIAKLLCNFNPWILFHLWISIHWKINI